MYMYVLLQNKLYVFMLLLILPIHPKLTAAGSALFIAPPCGAFDLGLAVSVPLPIVMGIFVLLWFQSRLT